MELPNFLDTTVLSNSVKSWLVSLTIILFVVIFGRVLGLLLKNLGNRLTSKTDTKYDDILFEIIQKPLNMLIFLVGLNAGINVLSMPEGLTKLKSAVFFIALSLNFAWILDRCFRSFINEIIRPLVDKSESTFDDQILPLAEKLVIYLIWIMAVIIGLDNAGYDAGAILAGLGIGGLAFALAAQDTVSNVFGGLTIFIDKPFMINDRILLGDIDGTVKEIGVRSTKLLKLDGRMVTVPNSQFTDNPILNISSEPTRKVVLTLGLTYSTDHKGIEKALEILKSIPPQYDDFNDESVGAFTNFNSYSLDITFIYYIKKGADIFEAQNKMNLKILSEFNAAGLEMAFPTQTLVHEGLTQNITESQKAA